MCYEGGVKRSDDNATSWHNVNLPTANYQMGAISRDGKIAILVSNLGIHISRDSGKTWVLNSTYTNLFRVCISVDARYIYVQGKVSNDVICSADFGNSFTKKKPELNSTLRIDSVSCSANGQYVVACVYGGYCYISFDFGATWNKISAINSYALYNRCAVSETGQYILISHYKLDCHISSDFGASWSQFSILGKVAMSPNVSADGQYMSIGDNYTYNNSINVSNDYGQTFSSKITNSSGLYSINASMSRDGEIHILTLTKGNISISRDYGQTFEKQQILTNEATILYVAFPR
jgi:BNR/Asp-box repeat.